MATSTVSFLAMAVVAMALLQAAAANPPPTPYGRPTSCAATLFELSNCAPFLTIGTVISGPPANCCAPLRAVLATPASICLCHTIGGEINELLRINIDPIRLALLPVACWAISSLPCVSYYPVIYYFFDGTVGPVPPISTIPPMPPSPPVTPPSPMPPSPPVTPPSPPMGPLP
ncbi:hypothetical protein SORBI_3002G402233 [Sorghum bicolor]|uniref:Bifunctional inhibitor/plant lipid transfer protein/seed storage helical domain-containing protein n=1 Tax=Sorghum bicolor TaxID=4558 RepID=A0A1W0W7P8_SORBI|nr:hypothetical protein SORBI_3002G402233 [Sorghum bicolor]